MKHVKIVGLVCFLDRIMVIQFGMMLLNWDCASSSSHGLPKSHASVLGVSIAKDLRLHISPAICTFFFKPFASLLYLPYRMLMIVSLRTFTTIF